MIIVSRPKEPDILNKNKNNWLINLKLAKIKNDKNLFISCQKKYGHKEIKKALEIMFSEKCAYCESTINIVTTGHIEHFRPKSRFISLTFDWENLLLSCPKCNDKQHKGTKFPSVYAGGRLINPSIQDPAIHFDFIFDPITQEALIKAKTIQGQTTALVFGLNSRKPLIKARSSLIKKLIVLKTYAHTDPIAAALLKEAKNSCEPYLAWVNNLL